MTSPEVGIGAEVAVVAESLSKRYRTARPRALPSSGADEAVVDDDELDDEAEAEEVVPEAAAERWALRDVSFSLPAGRALGMIGPAAAGKTTLLNVLGGVTRPTTGRALVRGRVVPLLPTTASLVQGDISGRQNVFLLASFLGVPRDVALRRMDEAMAFAGLDTHVDDPVDRYSSELQRRLPLAVALHFEPDILLADEGFLYGDAAFRTRCLTRIEELVAGGASLVLAANDLDLVRRLCTEALWLAGGRVVSSGPVRDILAAYEESFGGLSVRGPEQNAAAGAASDLPRPRRVGFNEHVALHSGFVGAPGGNRLDVAETSTPVEFVLDLEVASPMTRIRCGVIADSGTVRVTLAQPSMFLAEESGIYRVTARLPEGFAASGDYVGQIGAVVNRGGADARLLRTEAFTCRVVEARDGGTSEDEAFERLPRWTVEFAGRRIYPGEPADEGNTE
jgi:ABC-type polysaccharide/polyol phosphate transport system ATPase subunit